MGVEISHSRCPGIEFRNKNIKMVNPRGKTRSVGQEVLSHEFKCTLSCDPNWKFFNSYKICDKDSNRRTPRRLIRIVLMKPTQPLNLHYFF